VKEMEDQVRAATEGEAKAMTSVKAAQREVDQIAAKLERLKKGAELAMDKGDEATAREAVEGQISLEAELKQKTDILARCQTAQDDARAARKHIQEQLDELRAKKGEILARARTAKTRKKIERTVHGPAQSSRSILDAVARTECNEKWAKAAPSLHWTNASRISSRAPKSRSAWTP
jgi:phage shock protein A